MTDLEPLAMGSQYTSVFKLKLVGCLALMLVEKPYSAPQIALVLEDALSSSDTLSGTLSLQCRLASGTSI
jgi:hypothetical protein